MPGMPSEYSINEDLPPLAVGSLALTRDIEPAPSEKVYYVKELIPMLVGLVISLVFLFLLFWNAHGFKENVKYIVPFVVFMHIIFLIPKLMRVQAQVRRLNRLSEHIRDFLAMSILVGGESVLAIFNAQESNLALNQSTDIGYGVVTSHRFVLLEKHRTDFMRDFDFTVAENWKIYSVDLADEKKFDFKGLIEESNEVNQQISVTIQSEEQDSKKEIIGLTPVYGPNAAILFEIMDRRNRRSDPRSPESF